MNRSIRRLGIALLIAYTVLFAQLNNLQLFGAQRLNKNPLNAREAARDFDRPRGTIATADGVIIARSVETPEGPTKRRREYPEAYKYAQIVGYFSRTFGSTGVERTYNDELSGMTLEQKYGNLSDLFNPKDRTGNVALTIRSDVQQAAWDALGDRLGSVVAIDPRDGSILAMASVPSFDPNLLADPNRTEAQKVKDALEKDPQKPLLAKSYRENFFPGSTFKVVTASAGLESGTVTPDAPVYPRSNAYVPPLTDRPLRNFGGETCGGALFDVLRVSCNTAFARMGAETIGADRMIERAEAFGFNQSVPIDLPDAAKSAYPTNFGKRLQTIDQFYAKQNGEPPPTTQAGGPAPVYVVEDTPRLAQTAIGQNDVKATPLEMAMVAAAIANNGVIMTPHVMQDIKEQDGTLVRAVDVKPWRTAVSPEVSATMRDAMVGVVQGGTATRLAIEGFTVGGKTGTAQLGTDPPQSHAWILGFAGPPGQPATVAVAVIVEAQPGASEQTGGRVAAPIAQAVLKAALGVA
ncbi:MAG TPA: penicillin-binding transpeptidase domain-containing protein [Acidimicrobiales bacterium]|nr:penicillin-binding transpeptidase domain-containing protein [Acidimicrobiales bacterium]